MDLIEFVGFIVTMGAMIFLAIARMWEAKKQDMAGEEENEPDPRALRQFLKSVDLEMINEDEFEEESQLPPRKVTPPPTPPQLKTIKKSRRTLSDEYALQSQVEQYEKQEGVQARTLRTTVMDPNFQFSAGNIVSKDLDTGSIVTFQDEEPSFVAELVHDLPSLQSMILYHEILSSPKSLKKIPWHEIP